MMGLRSVWVVALLCALSGCPSERDGAMPLVMDGPQNGSGSGSGSGAGGSGGASGTGANGDAGVAIGAFSVAIDATSTRVCAGACVQLTARAEQGHAPYAYAWSAGLGTNPGPVEVCPETTTTYSVTVTDTAIDGEEFDRPSAAVTASRVIEVDGDPDCVASPQPDSGTPPEPTGSTTELCSVRVPSAPGWLAGFGWGGNAGVAVDGDGNAYVAGLLQDTLTVGDQTITPVSSRDSLVFKYDANCELVWVKHLAGSSMASAVGLSAIAVGQNGELVVVGTLMGDASFGANHVSSGAVTAGLVVKLSTDDGSVLWNRVYGEPESGAAFWDVGIDDAGNVVFSGTALGDVSFGDAPIGSSAIPHSCVVQLSSEGEHRYSFGMPDTDIVAMTAVAVHGSGAVAVAGWSTSSSVTVNGTSIELAGPRFRRYLARLEPTGAVAWGQQITVADGPSTAAQWGGSLIIDGDGAAVIEHGWEERDALRGTTAASRDISKVSAGGEALWTHTLDGGTWHLSGIEAGALAVDTHRNVLHADEVDDPSVPTPELPGPPANPQNLVRVRKLSAAGQLVWSYAFGQGDMQWIWGLATAPDDAVWVAHGEEMQSSTGVKRTMVLTKLAP